MSEKDFNKMFSNKLKYYLNYYKISQAELARRLDVSSQSVTNWVNGTKSPRMKYVDKMCSIFSCNRSDLIEDKPINPPKKDRNRIPVLGRVAAGIPIDAIEEVIDYEEIDDKLASTGELFGLKIKGDSMTPRICDGDVVIVRKQEAADSGDIVIATINGDDAVCKRLLIYGAAILLRSNNPIYEDIDVTGREDFKIVGKVIELRGKM